MCSSVTVKALQSGWDVFSQMAGFFSAATDVCPVIGEELMCRALAMAESRVSSLESGPTPAVRQIRCHNNDTRRVLGARCAFMSLLGDLPCSPLGKSIVLMTSSVMSDARRPFNLFSQNSCSQTDAVLLSFQQTLVTK